MKYIRNLVMIDMNLRKRHVGPTKPVGHKHSAIVGAICRQVPPLSHVFGEQTDTKNCQNTKA